MISRATPRAVRPIAVAAFLGMALPACRESVSPDGPSQEFVPEDVRIGSPGVAYLDPEVDPTPGAHRMAFLDGDLTVWIAELDPATGRFLTGSGQDYRIGRADFFATRMVNGPEWGRSARGTSLYFNGTDPSGPGQIFRSDPPFDRSTPTPVTGGEPGLVHALSNASSDGTLPSALLMGYSGRQLGSALAWEPGTVQPIVLDEGKPGSARTLPFPDKFHRWIPGTSQAVFASAASAGGLARGQVYLYEASTGVIRQVSDDGGNKVAPWGFRAPELGGELLIMAVVDGSALAVYRSAQGRSDAWARAATISLPSGTGFSTLTSAEPVIGGSGAAGRTLFTVEAHTASEDDSSIWLLGPALAGGAPFARRLDEGARTGVAGVRRDPESFLGSGELLVYYSLAVPGQPPQLRLARTGVTYGPGTSRAASRKGPEPAIPEGGSSR